MNVILLSACPTEEPGTLTVTVLVDDVKYVFTAEVEPLILLGTPTQLIHSSRELFKLPLRGDMIRQILGMVGKIFKGEPVELPLELSKENNRDGSV